MNKKIFILISLFSLLNATLPQAIKDFIYKDKIKTSNIAILINNEESGESIATLNERVSFNPASVAKVATSYAALLELGKNFRWPTQVYYSGKVKRGVLEGDLIIKAYGDPTLTSRNLRQFAKRLASYGIKEIKGDMIIDRSFFHTSNQISSGFDKNFVSKYNAMPDAMMLNEHLNAIKIVPKPNKIEAYRVGGDKSFKLINNMKAVAGSCKGNRAWPKMRFIKEPSSVTIVLEGGVSSKCKPFAISKVLSRSYMSFYYILKNYLNKEGIKFDGGVRLEETPEDAKLFFTHYSRPLINIVAKTLKESNNLYARHLFLLIGAHRYGAPATLSKGQLALKEILGERGLIEGEFLIVNGSGLSRKARVNAVTIAKINKDAYQTFGYDWLKSLSIAGVDGTLKRRFKNSVAKNKAFMKTGTLKKAKNIAGFVEGKNGVLYNVVIFYNGARIWLGKDLQDKIINWLVKRD
ncbi:MAG: D-alanyl-D-alanine carboxypeptidase/D-alanyl-D-alanine-endopeptidase [Epsilonproteobacteria bacterium]|nr:D-alanyl-D-alanine carboxypeptidase/D-alanyl-D-alanine-endopeptidase [Campylobacterota bacterium]